MKTCRCLLALLLSACMFAGCSCSGSSIPGPGPGSGKPPNPVDTTFKRRTASELPVVDDYLPPLDDGRIEIAGPEGWNPLPRSSKYLAGFVKGRASDLPRIVVTVGDPPAAKLADTNEKNADMLAALLSAELRKDTTKRVPERCLPIVLGQHVFIRHVRLASLGGDPAVIQSLQTVRSGKLYTVELFCNVDAADGREYRKSLTDERDNGYAVAANLKFGTAADPLAGIAAEPGVDLPPAEAPAPPVETPAAPAQPADPATPAPTPAPPQPASASPAEPAPAPPQP
jgi:hypothetical protein